MKITFVTGNQKKADYLSQYIGFPVNILKAQIEEIQSMDLKEIVEHKLNQAYALVKWPVVVEDVSLGFEALGWLPGPFVKFFLDNTPIDAMCSMIWADATRKATAKCLIGYYDWETKKFFEWNLKWKIPLQASRKNSFGWDKIFIPDWYNVTRDLLDEADDKKTYLQIKRLDLLKEFLESEYE